MQCFGECAPKRAANKIGPPRSRKTRYQEAEDSTRLPRSKAVPAGYLVGRGPSETARGKFPRNTPRYFNRVIPGLYRGSRGLLVLFP